MPYRRQPHNQRRYVHTGTELAPDTDFNIGGDNEIERVFLPKEVESPKFSGDVRSFGFDGKPFFSLLKKNFFLDDIIIIGIIIVLITEGIEDDILLLLLIYLFVTSRD